MISIIDLFEMSTSLVTVQAMIFKVFGKLPFGYGSSSISTALCIPTAHNFTRD